MAHNLAVIGGKEAMAYQGETPWHKLGTRMNEGHIDVAAAMVAANLNWKVSLEPLFVVDEFENKTLVPYNKAVKRDVDGAIIGAVGSKSIAIQNEEVFSVLEPACKEFGVTIESAGALGRGERVWMLAKLPENIEPVPGDVINSYFLVSYSHDNMHALEGMPTPVRVVCQNTLSAAVSMAGGVHTKIGRAFRIKKTKTAASRIEVAAQLVKKMIEAMKATNDSFASLAAKRMTPEQVANYIESVFPVPENAKRVNKAMDERRKVIAQLVWTGKGAAMAGSTTSDTTAWAAYNAVTEYFDHVAPAGAKNDAQALRMNTSALFGSFNQTKLLALKNALQLVAA